MHDDAAQTMTLDAEWVLTMAGDAIYHGRVVIQGSRIVAVGQACEVAPAGEHVDLGESVLLPGLINAHCHLELSAYHGALPTGDFWSWIGGLVHMRMATGAATCEQQAAPAAVRTMLEWGTTCVGDISRSEWIPWALLPLPIRKVCYIELISGARTSPSNIKQLQQRIAEIPADDPLLVRAISPHAPYTVTREDLLACVAMASQQQLPIAMHLGETVEEIQWLQDGTGPIAAWHDKVFVSPPMSPCTGAAQYALSAGLTCAALIHMSYAADWELLCTLPERERPSVVYCPRSHHFFGRAPHPFAALQQAGVPVALGTDSAASHTADDACPTSILHELRWLRPEQPEIDPLALLRMVTVHGAAALGQSHRVGRIVPGLEADLIAFPCGRCHVEQAAATIVDGKSAPSLVVVAGAVISCL